MTNHPSIPAGLPTEEELLALANQFEPEVCSRGIDALLTSGDTRVLDHAAAKAAAAEETLRLGDADYTRLIDDALSAGAPLADALPVNAGNELAYRPSVISVKEADGFAPDTQKTAPSAKQSGIVVGSKSLEDIRRDFPILSEKINGHDLVWLDNGATTQRPQAVIDRLVRYYRHENSNVHRGAHELAARSTDA